MSVAFVLFFKKIIIFLGKFTKLRKATMRFAMPVCFSVCMEQLGFH